MEAKKQNNKLLLIAGVSFIVVFALVLVLVNSWLKNILKEEMVTQKPAAITIPSEVKSKYKQEPIVVPEAQDNIAGAKQKPASAGEAGVAPEQPSEKVPATTEKFLVD